MWYQADIKPAASNTAGARVLRPRFAPSIRIINSILLLVWLSAPALSQEWRHGRGSVLVGNMSPPQARQKAWDLARQHVLENASLEMVAFSAEHIKEVSGQDLFDQFIQYTSAFTRGRIVDEVVDLDTMVIVQVVRLQSILDSLSLKLRDTFCVSKA